jgi:lysophospholipase L1-like esterase
MEMEAVKRVQVCVAAGGIVLAALGTARVQAAETSVAARDPEVTRWEPDIAALEALDGREADPPDAILFVGSSSIRLWDSIAADMAPWSVVRRGYGGARYRDLCHFAPRLVANHDPRAIVVFVGNDIVKPGESPAVAEVMVDVRATLAGIRGRHPRVPVCFVAVTPTESRWRMWPEISRLNAALEALAADDAGTFFIATAERFLDPDTGRPIPELFRDDRLHLSQAGYAVWARVIAAALDEVLADAQAESVR